jgi:uncharacterized protein
MILRDPVFGLVSFEAEEYQLIPRLLETREVQRLRRIRQLGLTSFAYPGADHTRFSHAIGAAHVMTRFVRRLREIDGSLPFWQRITTERARDAVAAALLHDIGHGPFSHLFEEAVPEGPHHETWTERMVLDPSSETHRVLLHADASLPARVAELIRGKHQLPYLSGTVSGMFDVDRCDYLLRDALFTGVSYGHFDLDWLLRSLRLGKSANPDSAPSLAVDGAKGIPAIESFIQARLFMFQQVYFHKASRSSEWMLARILRRARDLLHDGARLAHLPEAVESLVLTGDASLEAFLEIDDAALWQGMRAWQQHSDPVLSDLCQRLCQRRLFKTYEFFGHERDPEYTQLALELARELATERGFDPDIYVGLDEATLIPFDDSKDQLEVIFPSGPARPLHEVSFLINRLRGQQMSSWRLIFPKEIRTPLLERMGSLPHA